MALSVHHALNRHTHPPTHPPPPARALQAFIAGYGDVGKGSAAAMKAAGARVVIGEIDPICALQATMEGYTVAPLEDVLETADIFITTTGNKDIIMADHMARMKNNAIVGNIGHFDNEIDMAGLLSWPGIKRQNIKPQCDRFIFPDGHGVIMLAEVWRGGEGGRGG